MFAECTPVWLPCFHYWMEPWQWDALTAVTLILWLPLIFYIEGLDIMTCLQFKHLQRRMRFLWLWLHGTLRHLLLVLLRALPFSVCIPTRHTYRRFSLCILLLIFSLVCALSAFTSDKGYYKSLLDTDTPTPSPSPTVAPTATWQSLMFTSTPRGTQDVSCFSGTPVGWGTVTPGAWWAGQCRSCMPATSTITPTIDFAATLPPSVLTPSATPSPTATVVPCSSSTIRYDWIIGEHGTGLQDLALVGDYCVTGCTWMNGFFHSIGDPIGPTIWYLPVGSDHYTYVDQAYAHYNFIGSGSGCHYHQIEIYALHYGNTDYNQEGCGTADFSVYEPAFGATGGLYDVLRLLAGATGSDEATWSGVELRGHYFEVSSCSNATLTPTIAATLDNNQYCRTVHTDDTVSGFSAGDIFGVDMWLLSPETCSIDTAPININLSGIGLGYVEFPGFHICFSELRTGEIVFLGMHIRLDNLLAAAEAIMILRWVLRGQ